MKKAITILMLIAAIMVGTATAEAKTTKKSKSSSSSSWNGDIPSASLIYKLYVSNNGSELKKHGYKEINESDPFGCPVYLTWVKSGVCKIFYEHGCEAGDDDMRIEVYDSSKCTKLYNDLKKKYGKKFYITREGNQIYMSWDN